MDELESFSLFFSRENDDDDLRELLYSRTPQNHEIFWHRNDQTRNGCLFLMCSCKKHVKVGDDSMRKIISDSFVCVHIPSNN